MHQSLRRFREPQPRSHREGIRAAELLRESREGGVGVVVGEVDRQRLRDGGRDHVPGQAGGRHRDETRAGGHGPARDERGGAAHAR